MTSRPDAYAALLGIEVDGRGGGRAVACLQVDQRHLNPHGTAHGALIYSLAGIALAAAANDQEHSGIVSAVHIDYLQPARAGDRLTATADLAERLPKEDVFVVRDPGVNPALTITALSEHAMAHVPAAGLGR